LVLKRSVSVEKPGQMIGLTVLGSLCIFIFLTRQKISWSFSKTHILCRSYFFFSETWRKGWIIKCSFLLD